MDELIRRLVSHWLLAAGMVLMPFGVAGAAPVRVALVGTHGAGVAGGVVALAEAQLSARDGLEVLDRQHVDRVLKEQKLAVGGLVDAAGAVKAGQLLSVDLFVVIEQSEDGKDTLGCVIYDAGNGLRLRDAALVAKELEGVVEEVVSAVDRAVARRAAGLKGLRTLSVVGVRNADLPQSLDGTCASLGMLLERELARGGDVALLERKRLSWLQQERGLAATEAEQKLLASMVLVDVEFSRHANGVRAAINLIDSKGVALHRATAESKSLDVSLLAPLADAVRKPLQVAPASTPTDSVRESRRFLREARLNWSFKLEEPAVAAAESALLLDPGSPHARLLLAEYLFRSNRGAVSKVVLDPRYLQERKRVVPAAVLMSLTPPLRRASELIEVASRRDEPRLATELLEWQVCFRPALNEAVSTLQIFMHIDEVSGPEADTWRANLDEMLSSHRQLRLRHLHTGFEVARREPAAIGPYSDAVKETLSGQYRYAFDPCTRAEVAVAATNEWLTLFEARSTEPVLLDYLDVILGRVTKSYGVTTYDAATIRPLYERLRRQAHPLLQLYGRQGDLYLSWQEQPVGLAETVVQVRALREAAFAILDEPAHRKETNLHSALYGFVRDGYSLPAPVLREADEAGRRALTDEIVVACEAMLARRDAHGYLLKQLSQGASEMDPESRKRSHATLVSAIRLLESDPPPATFEWSQRTTHDFVVNARNELERKWPGLRRPAGDEPTFAIKALYKGESSPRWAPPYANMIVGWPLVVGDHAYIMKVNVSPRREPETFATLRTMRIPLDATPVSELGTVTIKANDLLKRQEMSSLVRTLVRATCSDGGRLFAAVAGQGIVVLDLKTSESRWLPAVARFPTPDVQSLAWHDGTLYAGLAGGYLVKCDPARDGCEVLVSSRRSEKKSPLDDVEAFDVPMLGFDQPRQRLLFAITRGDYSRGSVELWEHVPRDNRFRRLFEAGLLTAAISPLHNDRMIFTKAGWLLSYDAATDKPFVLSSHPLGPALHPTRQQVFTAPVRQAVHCADRVWFGDSLSGDARLGSVRLEAGKPEFIPVDLAQPAKPEPLTEWITTPVDDRRFLWSNRRHLWLVTPESPAKEDAPSPTVPR